MDIRQGNNGLRYFNIRPGNHLHTSAPFTAEHTFSFQNRDFAIINIDMQFTVSDDFSTVYLCELKDGKMQVHTKFDLPYFTRWELKNNEFVLYNNDNMQKTQL